MHDTYEPIEVVEELKIKQNTMYGETHSKSRTTPYLILRMGNNAMFMGC